MDLIAVATFVFSVIAAAAATVVARWEWIDRPAWGWRIILGVNDQTGDSMARIFCEGSVEALNVDLRAVGFRFWEPHEQFRRARMQRDSDPIDVTYGLENDGREAYIEITWSTSRPRRMRGIRYRMGAAVQEEWRWYWRSLRMRRSRGARPRRRLQWARLWEYRLVRTRGRWIEPVSPLLHQIPQTALGDPESNA